MLARWLRVLLMLIALVDLVTGVWAIFAPHGFFTTYPGFGHHWVAANPPYNEHLVLDTGTGFLAVGMALLVAAANASRLPVLVGVTVMLAHEVPHFLFHLFEPAGSLGTVEKWASTGSLGLEIVIGIVVLASLPGRSVDRDPTSFYRAFAPRSQYAAAPPADPADE
jgi:hypothetical protein